MRNLFRRVIALLFAVLFLAPFQCAAGESGGHGPDTPETVGRLISESLVEPKVRLTSTDIRVRELMGRFPLGKADKVDEALLAFIGRHRDAFGLDEPYTELTVSRSETAGNLSRVVFIQLYRGIPVWGRTLVMDVNADGELVVAVSRIGPVEDLKTEPAVSGLAAVRTARAEWEKSRKDEMPPCAKELVIYKGALAYNVRVPAGDVVYNFFVDAMDGKLVDVDKSEKDPSGACH